jgi:hypothetical protein
LSRGWNGKKALYLFISGIFLAEEEEKAEYPTAPLDPIECGLVQ